MDVLSRRYRRIDDQQRADAHIAESFELDGLVPRANADGQWKPVPYCAILRRAAFCLAVLASPAAMYGSTTGWSSYHAISLPHRAHIGMAHEISNGTAVVRPYFGPASSGAFASDVALDSTFWCREGQLRNDTVVPGWDKGIPGEEWSESDPAGSGPINKSTAGSIASISSRQRLGTRLRLYVRI